MWLSPKCLHRILPLFAGTFLICGDAAALTIYRFGGEDVPPPPEAEADGVEFVQRSWLDPVDDDLGGEVHQVDLSESTVRARRYDPDENIGLTADDRGEGVKEGTRKAEHVLAVDADTSTVWYPEHYSCVSQTALSIGRYVCGANTDYRGIDAWIIGLGGFFYIDRVRVISGLRDEAEILKNFRIFAASGRVASVSYGITSTTQQWFLLGEVRENRITHRDVWIPPNKRVDFLQLQHGEHHRDWAVHEIEIYARGFVDQSTYVSDIIPFERPTAWGELSWSGQEDPGAEVRIHTRSGNTLDQNLYWQWTGRGEKVQVADAKAYKRLKLREKAGTTYDLDNWTFWSAPYDLADSTGTPVVSLSPRQYFQFKVDIIPENEAGGELRYLEFRVSDPLASALIGEVFPTEAPVAESSSFTYYLQPSIAGNASGFNGIEMSTGSILNGVDAVRIGEADARFEAIPLDGNGNPQDEWPAHRFELTFLDKELKATDSGTPIEIDFNARVLRTGATVAVRVLDTNQPLAVRQQVAAGDANGLVEGNTVSVSTTAAAASLLQTQVSSAVVTPNGDGANDVVWFDYDLLEFIGAAAVTIEINDLTGRVVRQVYAGDDIIGHYDDKSWDGRDDAGQLVPPGVYLYRIELGTDREEKASSLGVLSVAY